MGVTVGGTAGLAASSHPKEQVRRIERAANIRNPFISKPVFFFSLRLIIKTQYVVHLRFCQYGIVGLQQTN